MKTLQVPIEWMTAIREPRYALLGETIGRNAFICQSEKEKIFFFCKGPTLHSSTSTTLPQSLFFTTTHATLCALRSDSVNSGWKREEMLAQCLGLSKHHERMLNTPSQTPFLSKWHLYENEAKRKQTSGWKLNGPEGRREKNMDSRSFTSLNKRHAAKQWIWYLSLPDY